MCNFTVPRNAADNYSYSFISTIFSRKKVAFSLTRIVNRPWRRRAAAMDKMRWKDTHTLIYSSRCSKAPREYAREIKHAAVQFFCARGVVVCVTETCFYIFCGALSKVQCMQLYMHCPADSWLFIPLNCLRPFSATGQTHELTDWALLDLSFKITRMKCNIILQQLFFAGDKTRIKSIVIFFVIIWKKHFFSALPLPVFRRRSIFTASHYIWNNGNETFTYFTVALLSHMVNK